MSIPGYVAWPVRILLLAYICRQAYIIRLHAIEEYGLVIHEFDPWFNYRATEYLKDHGLSAFFKWYDYMVWYPLGRPVGTTIYPGMQMTAVFLHKILNDYGINISLNDVCCYVPAWFGVSATLWLGFLAWESTGSPNIGLAGAWIMSIVPAHLMRSVGGGYDNESIAMTAMIMTFYWWVRSLRSRSSSWLGVLAGLSYIYMVAAWGGYVFVINMVGFSAAAISFWNTILEKDMTKIHRAYTLFYVIGTYGAMQIPVVGWTPLKSLEQLGPFFVCLAIQVLYGCDYIARRDRLNRTQAWILRFKVVGGMFAASVFIIMFCMPKGYFGPLSSRVRGLFVKHTRTGNPLVDSVAEHQPASAEAYYQYLQNVYYMAPFGFMLFFSRLGRRSDEMMFLILYALVAWYFANKMTRLILLLSPIASVTGAAVVVFLMEWVYSQFEQAMAWIKGDKAKRKDEEKVRAEEATTSSKKERPTSSKKPKKDKEERLKKTVRSQGSPLTLAKNTFLDLYESDSAKAPRLAVAALVAFLLVRAGMSYYNYCWEMSYRLSHPSLMYKARMNNGQTIMVDDYREAYWWLRDNTPEDSRVMSWWDYGYQITGIANRTTIADGNTWNHEHIALLGRCMVSPPAESHKIIKHLADYVLVWIGGGGDDLAKSPHMARISNSVYKFICPGDPTCAAFGFHGGDRNKPTDMMRDSFIYQMHQHGIGGVRLDETLFEQSFVSKYQRVKIFKVLKKSLKSKEWIADPANRICDAPGSWYCTGQYPPALDFLKQEKKDFQQLEDFNVEKDEEHEIYQKQYMARMAGQRGQGIAEFDL